MNNNNVLVHIFITLTITRQAVQLPTQFCPQILTGETLLTIDGRGVGALGKQHIAASIKNTNPGMFLPKATSTGQNLSLTNT